MSVPGKSILGAIERNIGDWCYLIGVVRKPDPNPSVISKDLVLVMSRHDISSPGAAEVVPVEFFNATEVREAMGKAFGILDPQPRIPNSDDEHRQLLSGHGSFFVFRSANELEVRSSSRQVGGNQFHAHGIPERVFLFCALADDGVFFRAVFEKVVSD